MKEKINLKAKFIRTHKELLGKNLSYQELDKKYIEWLEEIYEELKCCANCNQFECPHRDLFSLRPCYDDIDKWTWRDEND